MVTAQTAAWSGITDRKWGDQMVCVKCQNQIADSTGRFCPFCGHELVTARKPTPVLPPSPAHPEEMLVPVRCSNTKLPFLIRFRSTGSTGFALVSASPLREAQLRNPALSSSQLRISEHKVSSSYRGCPYCGNIRFWVDTSCGGRLCCHDGAFHQAVCPWCGSLGQLTPQRSISFKGMKGG